VNHVLLLVLDVGSLSLIHVQLGMEEFYGIVELALNDSSFGMFPCISPRIFYFDIFHG
jgi:hypothetical protein